MNPSVIRSRSLTMNWPIVLVETSGGCSTGEGGDPCYGGPKNIPMLLHHWYGGVDRSPRFREQQYLASYRRAYTEWRQLLNPDFQRSIDEEADLESVLTPYFSDRRATPLPQQVDGDQHTSERCQPHIAESRADDWGVGDRPTRSAIRRATDSVQLPRPSTHEVAAWYREACHKRGVSRSIAGNRSSNGQKAACVCPVHYWFQREMRRYAKKILSRRQVARVGIFNPDRVQQLLNYDIDEGPGRYGLRLWMLMTFEIWRRIVVDGEPV